MPRQILQNEESELILQTNIKTAILYFTYENKNVQNSCFCFLKVYFRSAGKENLIKKIMQGRIVIKKYEKIVRIYKKACNFPKIMVTFPCINRFAPYLYKGGIRERSVIG